MNDAVAVQINTGGDDLMKIVTRFRFRNRTTAFVKFHQRLKSEVKNIMKTSPRDKRQLGPYPQLTLQILAQILRNLGTFWSKVLWLYSKAGDLNERARADKHL